MSGLKKIWFARGISLNEINPDDVALKCPYMNNLITTAMALLPALNTRVDNISIIQGFVGIAKLNTQYKGIQIPHDIQQHSKGLAIKLTWKDYTKSYAVDILKELYENIDCNFKTIIREDDITFIQTETNKEIIEEYISDGKILQRTRKK